MLGGAHEEVDEDREEGGVETVDSRETGQDGVGQTWRQKKGKQYMMMILCERCGRLNYPILWQKKASDKSDISCKRAKCVSHFH